MGIRMPAAQTRGRPTLQARVAAYLGVAESDLHQVVERDGEVVVLLNTYAKHRIPLSALPDATEAVAPEVETTDVEASDAVPPPAKPKAATASKARRKPGL